MLYLASQSPRRKELLTQIGIEFELVSGNVNELQLGAEKAIDFVRRMALEKAQAGVENIKIYNKNNLVLGSDTIVVCNNAILGKPKNSVDSHKMLMALSGNKHQVITAVAIGNEQQMFIEHVITQVYFRAIDDTEITAYWQTGEPQDKAGSYAIQGLGGKFVTRIEGSYSAVVGLPLYETEQLLIKANNKLIKGVL